MRAGRTGRSLGRRLAWFGGLWLAGVAVVALVGGILRWLIGA